jgi:type I restriction enzyme S subunit
MIERHWSQNAPRDWPEVRIRDHVKLVNGFPFDSELFSTSDGWPLVRIRDISTLTTVVRYSGEFIPEAVIRKGDVLIGMDGEFNVARWQGEDALLNQRVCCLRSTASLDARFLSYILPIPLRVINALTYSTTVKHLSSFDILKIRFRLPPKPVQHLIADFLDAETQQIDALIAEKERMLALLEEKWAVVATNLATSGVVSNEHSQKTSIRWLSEISIKWKIRRAKLLFKEIDQRSETGEETLLSLRMERGLVPHNDVSEKPILAEHLIGYKIARKNEIVLNRMRAASGLVAVAHQYGIVSPDYAVFRALDDVDPEYFALLFKTSILQAVFRSLSKGLGTGESGFLRLYSEDFLNIKLPVPPFGEQKAIVAELARQRARTAEVEETLAESIKLLKERRVALIAAAVTGQIEPEAMTA